MKKLTTEEFIEKAQKIHKNRYDYSEVNYINSRSKVCIICKEHGKFWQLANAHLQGQGCPMCNSKNIPLTKDQFIKQAIEVHQNKYDYSEVPEFPGSHIPVSIICSIHGKFLQSTYAHRSGQGCPKCANEKNAIRQTYTWGQLKEKFNKIHNNKYDYSQVNYINMETPITIICPRHGKFQQKPKDHIRKAGCQKCKKSKGETYIERVLKDLKISFESQFKIKYNNTHLLVDFKIVKNNQIYFIEYNGIQHYKPIKYFGGELKFQKQCERDDFLRQYCIDNNIKLIEIKYNMKDNEIYELINNIVNES